MYCVQLIVYSLKCTLYTVQYSAVFHVQVMVAPRQPPELPKPHISDLGMEPQVELPRGDCFADSQHHLGSTLSSKVLRTLGG